MRLLAFSDIHNNVSCVEVLRAQEANEYDALLVAGDIGSERFEDILGICNTFECPVLFTYGNWDNKGTYKQSGRRPSGLVHHSVHEIGDYFITGYSGCITQWGQNPDYVELMQAVELQHADAIAAYALGVAELTQARKDLEADVQQTLEEKLSVLASKPGDKRKSAHRRRVIQLNRQAEERLQKATAVSNKAWQKLLQDKAYLAYQKDRAAAGQQANRINRDKLDAILCKIDPRRTLVMTHERQYRWHERGTPPLLHLFGHEHAFKHTVFKETHCVNVAALDHALDVKPRQDSKAASMYRAEAGGYCVFTLSGGSVEVERRRLIYDEVHWEAQDYGRFATEPLPDQKQFASGHSPYKR